jgi:RNA binding exosome subunit
MANNIHYICLSDLHLGEEDSLLTNLRKDSRDPDPRRPSPVMEELVRCMRFLIGKVNYGRKPVLILNGDILELALTNLNQAAMVFERFIELVMPRGEELFSGIIYIPGNHDHHFWESARETQYTNYITGFNPGRHLPVPWHVTNMYAKSMSDRPASYFLTRLIQRQSHLRKKRFTVRIAYPNLGILNKTNQNQAIFHHGHFADPMYQLMSSLKTLLFEGRELPRQIWDIEAENFAWIDFFWSTMGRSGEFGRDIELIYEKMRDIKEFKKVLTTLTKNLDRKYNLPGWDPATRKFLEWILHGAADKALETERRIRVDPLSKKSKDKLSLYLRQPLWEQMRIERKDNILADVIFVFGHTHKPFQKDMNFRGYPQWVNVYNTGGWTVDTVKPETVYGASMVLIDETMNATSIRMYDQCENLEDYRVRVLEAKHRAEESNPFHCKIDGLVDANEEPWRSFSSAAARAVGIRAKNLEERIHSG